MLYNTRCEQGISVSCEPWYGVALAVASPFWYHPHDCWPADINSIIVRRESKFFLVDPSFVHTDVESKSVVKEVRMNVFVVIAMTIGFIVDVATIALFIRNVVKRTHR